MRVLIGLGLVSLIPLHSVASYSYVLCMNGLTGESDFLPEVFEYDSDLGGRALIDFGKWDESGTYRLNPTFLFILSCSHLRRHCMQAYSSEFKKVYAVKNIYNNSETFLIEEFDIDQEKWEACNP